MSLSKLILGASALFTVVASAEAVWGVKELNTAMESAEESFLEVKGQKAFDAITGFSIERTSQKTAAKAKINYKVGTVLKSVSYFCHVHGPDEIDCH